MNVPCRRTWTAAIHALLILASGGWQPLRAQDAVEPEGRGLWVLALGGGGDGSNRVSILGSAVVLRLVGPLDATVETSAWRGSAPVCTPRRGCRNEGSTSLVWTGGLAVRAVRVGRMDGVLEVQGGLLKDPLGPSDRVPVVVAGVGVRYPLADAWAARAGFRYLRGVSSDDPDINGERMRYGTIVVGVAYRLAELDW